MADTPPSDILAAPAQHAASARSSSSVFFSRTSFSGRLCRVAGLGNPGGIKPFFLQFVHVRQWTDSWLPMLKSLDYFHAHPSGADLLRAPLRHADLSACQPASAGRAAEAGPERTGNSRDSCSHIVARCAGRRCGVAVDGPAAAAAPRCLARLAIDRRCDAGVHRLLSAHQGIRAGQRADVSVASVRCSAAAVDDRTRALGRRCRGAAWRS